MSLSDKQVIGRNVWLFVVVYKLVNVVLTLEWYCVPVYQCTKSHSQERKPNQVIGINISVHVLMPEAICCCLHTCKSCMLNVLVGIAL